VEPVQLDGDPETRAGALSRGQTDNGGAVSTLMPEANTELAPASVFRITP
jgi:hypothetical protein